MQLFSGRFSTVSRTLAGLGLLSLLSCATEAQMKKKVTGPPKTVPPPELWVSGYHSDSVHRYDLRSSDPMGDLGAVPGAQSATLGPDGLLYVCAEKVNQVMRFRGTRFIDVFVGDDPATPVNETGGLNGPTAAIFGPDGNLYVASFNNDAVLRYDGFTGAFMNAFITSGRGGLDGPDAGMTFGPDGHLYVPSFNSSDVIKYNGTFGWNLGKFIPALRGGLRNPRMLLFQPDGSLFVSGWANNRISRYSASGDFIEHIAVMSRPTGFAISPYDGLLYITSDQTDRVRRFNLLTRQFVDTFIPDGSGGLSGATFITFVAPKR